VADGREWCSQWIHWDLQLAGFWQRLLPRCGSLTIINASPTVRATMEKHLGIAIEQIRMPEKHIVRSRWPDDSGEAAFPDAYERVAKQLDRPLSGKVFVVAAGLVGKSFCHLIKANGGVAGPRRVAGCLGRSIDPACDLREQDSGGPLAQAFHAHDAAWARAIALGSRLARPVRYR
jgi:hypothetical protein